MQYQYVNDVTGETMVIERRLGEEIPKTIVSPETGRELRFDWTAVGGFHIPEHMKATGGVTENRFDYGYKRTKTVF